MKLPNDHPPEWIQYLERLGDGKTVALGDLVIEADPPLWDSSRRLKVSFVAVVPEEIDLSDRLHQELATVFLHHVPREPEVVEANEDFR